MKTDTTDPSSILVTERLHLLSLPPVFIVARRARHRS